MLGMVWAENAFMLAAFGLVFLGVGLIWTYTFWPAGGVVWSWRRLGLYGGLLLAWPLFLICLAAGWGLAGPSCLPTGREAWLSWGLAMALAVAVSALLLAGLWVLLRRWAGSPYLSPLGFSPAAMTTVGTGRKDGPA